MKIGLFSGAFFIGFILTVAIRFSVGFATVDSTIPVSLSTENDNSYGNIPVKSLHKPIEIKLQWGAFYTAKGPRGYWVFRLLDVSADTLHFQSYRRAFDNPPNLVELKYLVPTSKHIVKKSEYLLEINPTFVGSQRLNPDDLTAYLAYLEKEEGMTKESLKATSDRLISFSKEIPLKTRLSSQNGRLTFDSVTQ